MSINFTIDISKPGRVTVNGIEYFAAVDVLGARYTLENTLYTEQPGKEVCKWVPIVVTYATDCGYEHGPILAGQEFCPWCGHHIEVAQ